ncbi:MAG: VanZ family protein [Lachnospiraceae bacterium]|nr:VanZ family protein [Lachnospiraceae bacterium]
MKKTGKILSAVPAAIWAYVIWFFSDTPAAVSTDEGITVTEILLNLIGLVITVEPEKRAFLIAALEPHIRKIAHMTEFGILFLLLMIPLGLLIRKLSIRTGTAVFVSFLYACSDEIHQLFVEGRAGRVSDVLIDMMGVVIAALLYLIIAIPISLKKQQGTHCS